MQLRLEIACGRFFEMSWNSYNGTLCTDLLFQAVISRGVGRKERGFRKKVREGVSKGIHHQKRFRKNAGTYLWCILRLELPGLNLRQGTETDIYLRQPLLLKFCVTSPPALRQVVGTKTRLWGVISRGSYIIDTVGSGRSKGEVYRGFHSRFGCRGRISGWKT